MPDGTTDIEEISWQESRASESVPGEGGRVLWSPREVPAPGPDASGDLERYRMWLGNRARERLARKDVSPRSEPSPELAVVLLVHQAIPARLKDCLHALTHQTSDRWRLSITIAGTPGPAVEAVLGDALAGFGSGRLSVHRCPGGSAASAAEVALEASSSPCVMFLGPHDQLAPDAVELLAAGLVDADVSYADEDGLGEDGLPMGPVLKPDWSPELCLGWNYVGRPAAYRRALVEVAGGIHSVDHGDWEHDLLLRVTERTSRVAHVPEVLCHRYPGDGGKTGPAAVEAALQRRHVAAVVEPGPLPTTWRVRRQRPAHVLVSVVIPFRDSTTFLRSCVESVLATAHDIELELLLVDNGSTEPETLTLLERLDTHRAVTVLSDPRPFNWAALNNHAVRSSTGDVLLFLNDDVEVTSPTWIDALVAQALRDEVGAVGARLLYPTDQVQFAGTVLRLGGAAGHVLAGLPGDRPGYLGMAVLTRDVSAVTGACMATRRAVFDRLGGFDEHLGVDCNDVDYCLRARAAGWRVVYEPMAELYHYESPTRGMSGNADDIIRFVDRWEQALLAGDPYLNANLTRLDGSAALAGTGELDRWWEWRAQLGDSS